MTRHTYYNYITADEVIYDTYENIYYSYKMLNGYECKVPKP